MKQNNRSDWLQQVASRIQSHWLIKGSGTTGAITAFMVAYFTLLRHPQFPVTMIPPTALDRLISFQPAAIVPYASLWLYISLVPALILRREYAPYLSAATVLGIVGLAIFLLWPTAVPQPDINWSLYPSVSFLKSLDAAGNACPSMHVAFSVFTACWLHLLLKRVGAPLALVVINVLWCLAIVWSTLAIKQHLALDMEAGAALGAAAAAVSLYGVLRRDAVDREVHGGQPEAAE